MPLAKSSWSRKRNLWITLLSSDNHNYVIFLSGPCSYIHGRSFIHNIAEVSPIDSSVAFFTERAQLFKHHPDTRYQHISYCYLDSLTFGTGD
ncbi:Hypothetical predicted protein [Olea europaea subsp. europaea]|uniref:Uncharacterized protein n=1 Tax=Olea europaea subsp. europaea TaxID=158383 RepID=A0A8S0PM11_OLEEU|nr:Hypothetical predicted protein [Olea europaea subsp. europaea]